MLGISLWGTYILQMLALVCEVPLAMGNYRVQVTRLFIKIPRSLNPSQPFKGYKTEALHVFSWLLLTWYCIHILFCCSRYNNGFQDNKAATHSLHGKSVASQDAVTCSAGTNDFLWHNTRWPHCQQVFVGEYFIMGENNQQRKAFSMPLLKTLMLSSLHCWLFFFSALCTSV